MRDRFQTLLAVLVLLGVGALIGSFWLGWRDARLTGGTANPGTAGVADPAPIKVEVLNGAGERGAARQVAMRLRDAGFDVVFFGNAQAFDHQVTAVVNRSGRPGIARRVAEALGADSVLTEVAPDLHLDATVILGRDWRTLAAVP